MKTDKTITFCSKIISWQRSFGRRDLPWTCIGWGYGVWVSEVMLQQTQVCTVLPRFTAFIQKFPTVTALASAKIDDVLAEWSGLGYYARAKNLHAAAKKIVKEHSNAFPESWEAVISLPGVGRTTAGAILSLAFQQKYPILDGNVKRILKRYFKEHLSDKIKEKELWELATRILPNAGLEISDYNQGLMDLGALVCTFRRPKCDQCPLRSECQYTNNSKFVEDISVNKRVFRKNCVITTWIFINNGKVFFEKVPKELKIWQDLYFFPITFGPFSVENEEAKIVSKTIHLKHLCTHLILDIHALVYENLPEEDFISLKNKFNLSGKWYSLEQIKQIGLSSPTFKLLKKINFAFETKNLEG